MSVIFYRDIGEENKYRVHLIHNQPYDEENGLSQDRIDEGLEVDSVPEKPATNDNERAILYCNPNAGEDEDELWYEVVSVE